MSGEWWDELESLALFVDEMATASEQNSIANRLAKSGAIEPQNVSVFLLDLGWSFL